MKRAVRNLLMTPQNNLKIFKVRMIQLLKLHVLIVSSTVNNGRAGHFYTGCEYFMYNSDPHK